MVNNINQLIVDLSTDSLSPQKNLVLGIEYENLGQLASAISFYLRAAEYGYHSEPLVVYSALLRASTCFEKQQHRAHTVSNLRLQAMAYLPTRPEAYFHMSKFYEQQADWQESYSFAIVGKNFSLEATPLPVFVDYHGEFCLDFQQAVAAWWIGREEESLQLLNYLSTLDLPEVYRVAVDSNLAKLQTKKPLHEELAERSSTFRGLLKTKVCKDANYIRMGSQHDGGYIYVNDFSKSDYVLSFGVDKNVDWELDASKFGCHIDMYDYSVDGPPVEVPNSKFYKKMIGPEFEQVSLEQAASKSKKDLILKMDIEGSEWAVLAQASTEVLSKFRQINIEFHDAYMLENELFYSTAISALENLRKTHTPVLVHANNNIPLMVIGSAPLPPVFEVLFLRNSSYELEEPVDQFAGLLTRNDTTIPEVSLSFP